MAVAFGCGVDVQRGKADELKNAALKWCNLKRNRTVMACIHLLSMFFSISSRCFPFIIIAD